MTDYVGKCYKLTFGNQTKRINQSVKDLRTLIQTARSSFNIGKEKNLKLIAEYDNSQVELTNEETYLGLMKLTKSTQIMKICVKIEEEFKEVVGAWSPKSNDSFVIFEKVENMNKNKENRESTFCLLQDRNSCQGNNQPMEDKSRENKIISERFFQSILDSVMNKSMNKNFKPLSKDIEGN
jgi:hypothetical protein